MSESRKCPRCGGRLSKDDLDTVCEICGYRESQGEFKPSLSRIPSTLGIKDGMRHSAKKRSKF